MTKQEEKDFQKFLDENQYSSNGILRYEKLFGRGFVSTGGAETTEEFVMMLNLKPGQKVLDVGCGIGGSAFFMIKNFGVDVLGVDLSTNMIDIGKQRAVEMDCEKVEFLIADITTATYEPASFDVIYSRDTILHIAEKEKLFANFLKWLKPGGQLLISDYCCGEGEHSDRFKAYVKQRHYHLLTVPSYGKMIENVGFIEVKAEDRTQQFTNMLQKEVKRVEGNKEEFLKDFTQEDYDALIKGWKDKLVRCQDGDQKWGLIYARKKQ
ncbi:phosphoethanolamine N-methyltransferase 1-like [Actinia tenebrosa]|uniref:phosphoethanolamine N-methyltransferase n=1 Tax=Actinia tenebrosa TaxID=6105 RepID=A0A6P8HD33_ACTTE|nr:phosphoethanolamine N-methyltransferase 1-like [Actinia tenebrosa]